VRLFSVTLTALMVLVSYFLVAEVLPGQHDAAFTAAALVSFQPMLSFVGSVVNNDILLNLITTAAIWALVRMWRHGVTGRRAIALGTALGLGMLTKPLIASLALPVACVFAREWRRGEQRQVVLLGLLTLVVALALCSWWVARSFDLNDGELYPNEVKKGYRIITEQRLDKWVIPGDTPWIITLPSRAVCGAAIGPPSVGWIRQRPRLTIERLTG
jgi:4-amino-4-deoxy-L-arabinose transferase-like glycosyltransferase